METGETNKLNVFGRLLLGGSVAGIIAAIINNLYHLIYSFVSGHGFTSLINFGSITLGSVVPAIIAAICYFILSRFTYKATRIFVIITLLLTVLTFAGVLKSEFPDGFIRLIIPMHIVAGLSIAFIIPRFVRK